MKNLINNTIDKMTLFLDDNKLNKMSSDSLRDELKSVQSEKQHNERSVMFYTAFLTSMLGIIFSNSNILVLVILILTFMVITSYINFRLFKKYKEYKLKIIQLTIKAK